MYGETPPTGRSWPRYKQIPPCQQNHMIMLKHTLACTVSHIHLNKYNIWAHEPWVNVIWFCTCHWTAKFSVQAFPAGSRLYHWPLWGTLLHHYKLPIAPIQLGKQPLAEDFDTKVMLQTSHAINMTTIYSKLYSQYKGQCFSNTFISMCSTISVEFISHLGAKFKTLYHILIWFILRKIQKRSYQMTVHVIWLQIHPDPMWVYAEFQGGSRPNKF